MPIKGHFQTIQLWKRRTIQQPGRKSGPVANMGYTFHKNRSLRLIR
jgi:hypothetical protein